MCHPMTIAPFGVPSLTSSPSSVKVTEAVGPFSPTVYAARTKERPRLQQLPRAKARL
jgi:hypothetical protein